MTKAEKQLDWIRKKIESLTLDKDNEGEAIRNPWLLCALYDLECELDASGKTVEEVNTSRLLMASRDAYAEEQEYLELTLREIA
jgi:hypothetical protein